MAGAQTHLNCKAPLSLSTYLRWYQILEQRALWKMQAEGGGHIVMQNAWWALQNANMLGAGIPAELAGSSLLSNSAGSDKSCQ